MLIHSLLEIWPDFAVVGRRGRAQGRGPTIGITCPSFDIILPFPPTTCHRDIFIYFSYVPLQLSLLPTEDRGLLRPALFAWRNYEVSAWRNSKRVPKGSLGSNGVQLTDSLSAWLDIRDTLSIRFVTSQADRLKRIPRRTISNKEPGNKEGVRPEMIQLG